MFKKYLSSFLGFSFVIGIVFAATTNINDISDKNERDAVTSEEFNSIVNTLKNIYNDGTNIGINQPIPQATLDVNGDVLVSNIIYNEIDKNIDSTCSTLGTDSSGNFKCKPSYDWEYPASWTDCSKKCGPGNKYKTATACKRDDGKTVDNSFCTASTKKLSEKCNKGSCHTYSWHYFGWKCNACPCEWCVCGQGSPGRKSGKGGYANAKCIEDGKLNKIVPNNKCSSSKPADVMNNCHECC